MTDISVQTTSLQVENRSWLLGPHGTEPGATPSITLDISKFTQGTHFPNGYIPSGCAIGIVTATQKYGPYDDTAVDGRAVARGYLFSSVQAVNTANGALLASVGAALLVHGFVKLSKLPFTGVAGAIDANGQADLTLIHHAA